MERQTDGWNHSTQLHFGAKWRTKGKEPQQTSSSSDHTAPLPHPAHPILPCCICSLASTNVKIHQVQIKHLCSKESIKTVIQRDKWFLKKINILFCFFYVSFTNVDCCISIILLGQWPHLLKKLLLIYWRLSLTYEQFQRLLLAS